MTDELLFPQMKSFSLMLLLMKHIIEVLSVRFKRDLVGPWPPAVINQKHFYTLAHTTTKSHPTFDIKIRMRMLLINN